MTKIKMFDGMVGTTSFPKMQRNQSNIIWMVGLQGLRVFYHKLSHENHMWLFGADEGREM